MTTSRLEPADFGWDSSFAAQIDPDSSLVPARVMAVHRGHMVLSGPGIDDMIAPFPVLPDDAPESGVTVGDWVLLDAASRPRSLVARRSLFKRRAPGTGRTIQLIAANVDTLFVVTSCNRDFNQARLERYLVLASEAGVTPVVVLTKADLVDHTEDYTAAAARLQAGLAVTTVDARDPESVMERLGRWCGRGRTVALMGSSGVGKSTLVNSLMGAARLATRPVREQDAKGRHTTTGRMLHHLPTGGWLMDTPGMRELQLTDVRAGIEDVFAEVGAVAALCRFRDCRHETEPGCAVRAAVEAGELDADRVRRMPKLLAEEARNTESLVARRARDRAFGRMAKRVMADTRRRREGR